MENMNMALVSSSSSSSPPLKLFLLGCNHPNYTLKNPAKTLPFPSSKLAPRRSRISIFAHSHSQPAPPRSLPHIVLRKLGDERFASISSSSSQQTSSVGVNPNPTAPPPSSQIGSPLFWIGVGVGLSALFTWVASSLKKYAMQQAFKTMMGQMNTQNNQFSNVAFPSGSPFPFPAPPSPGPVTSPSPSSQPAVTVDVPATKVEAAPAATPATEVKSEAETAEPKKYAFVDVSPEETVQKSAFEDAAEISSSNNTQFPKDVSDNGAASKQDAGAFGGSQSTGTADPALSVDALEKMMEDPTVQKMVYPYLPEEMRNPETFKWMLQNPQYRQQLQDMLNNMGGSTEWDNRMMDSLKNFDLNSAEVKQQFDQIGLTPEEVISKIMANPEVAMAFQNPRVQAAIMDCSQNPLSIAKYQNDKEVMDVFNKISELFPGVTGSP
ncbi:protein TIC 40, chloroplastic [Herrania umbratica]|uniref:Protein TIC 40, chloroplastic n=1 Tax=Herrania umbratica TaxID=108875 RepID=A0A6J1BD48_9ROSI|nr:protein TIC 40, chloroplastic [Herrania umbratica]